MQEEGFIAKLLYPEGAKDVKLGQVVAIVVDNKDDVAKFKDYTGAPAAAPAKSADEEKRSCPGKMERPVSAPEPSFPGAGPQRVIASPIAKKTAEETGVNLKDVKGSGPNDRIIKSDVQAAASKAIPQASASGEFEDIPLTNIRKVIADRLSYSKQTIPHYYVTVSVNVDNLLKLRAKLNATAKTKISVNDMVIKAASLACVKVPETNSSW